MLAIRAWHDARGDHHRDVRLIRGPAHGTNPASAQMVGMRVVVKCDAHGNLDRADLESKYTTHAKHVAEAMIAHPPTCGVSEAGTTRLCEIFPVPAGGSTSTART